MRVDLFGGAIQADYPDDLTDASDLRQVPDTQEVYLSNESDLSIILEVLELVTDNGAGDDIETGIRFLFESLAHDNGALSSSIVTVSSSLSSPPTTSQPSVQGPATLIGHQTVSKFNLPPGQADKVQLCVALWRLPSKNADLVLCVNMPLGKAVQQTTTNRVNGQDDAQDMARSAQAVFEQIVKTLEIKDFGLFAGGDA
ncbi:hypothetical protein ACM66B_004901 [Microbotryomycetes sp. NB124-2]